MPAQFRAHEVFTITGRAMVVSGEIMDGLIKKGMIADIPGWPQQLAIDDISMIRRTDGHPAIVGLVFDVADAEQHTRWTTLDIKGQLIHITGSAP